jgi:imidazolonepropionase-like amidohydrolase
MPSARLLLLLSAFATSFSVATHAADQVPGAAQTTPVLLSGGDVHTVSGDVIPSGQVLFDKGKIVAVGKTVEAPADAKRVDVAGKRVYPGLFAVGNDLGLTEVRSVRGTLDAGETGEVNPNARVEVAVNPDSELIPVARANGVLLNLTAPEDALLAGTSAVLQLDGWTWEELTLKSPAAVHVTWPRMGRGRARREPGQEEEQTRQRDEQLRKLDEAFAAARSYLAAKKARSGEGNGAARLAGGNGGGNSAGDGAGGGADATDASHHAVDYDARWEAMVPLLEGKVPLVVAADEVRQIEAAVAFAAREKVRLIVFGGYDAPRCSELLKKHNVPVIVNGVHRLPQRNDAPFDEPFTLPHRLKSLGISFCLTLSHRFGGSDVRNLPYHAATAAAHGLPPEDAVKAITLYPAQILGVADRVGSLEPGKDATLIVTTGDILETATRVEMAWVQGRPVDLTSKHTQLWEKYRKKYRREGDGPAGAADGAARDDSQR